MRFREQTSSVVAKMNERRIEWTRLGPQLDAIYNHPVQVAQVRKPPSGRNAQRLHAGIASAPLGRVLRESCLRGRNTMHLKWRRHPDAHPALNLLLNVRAMVR